MPYLLVLMPPAGRRIGKAASLQPKAFRWVFQGFLEVGYPDMAACALMQTQVAERGGLATHLEWSDLVEAKGKLRVKIREVNKKTQLRTIPLNKVVAKWLQPFQAKVAHLQVQVRVKRNNAEGYRAVPRMWPEKTPDVSAGSSESRSSCRLFPGLSVNYFERILREKVRPWLAKECAKNPDARSDMGNVDIARIRTHSFRRGPVTWLKDFVKSDVVVGGVAGMCAHRVRSTYDELSEERVKTAQAYLAPYVTCATYESNKPDVICVVSNESDEEDDVIIVDAVDATIESLESDESADESSDEASEMTDTSEDAADERKCHNIRRVVREEVRQAIAGLRSNIPADPVRARKTYRVR